MFSNGISFPRKNTKKKNWVKLLLLFFKSHCQKQKKKEQKIISSSNIRAASENRLKRKRAKTGFEREPRILALLRDTRRLHMLSRARLLNSFIFPSEIIFVTRALSLSLSLPLIGRIKNNFLLSRVCKLLTHSLFIRKRAECIFLLGTFFSLRCLPLCVG